MNKNNTNDTVWVVGLMSPTLKTIAFEEELGAENYLDSLDGGADAIEVELVPNGEEPEFTDPTGSISTKESSVKSWDELREDAEEHIPDDYRELQNGNKHEKQNDSESNSSGKNERQFDEDDFPELHLDDRLHLQRQYKMHGRERVVGWLRAKVALPTRLELSDNPNEEGYYNAMADYHIDIFSEHSEQDTSDHDSN